MSNTDRIIGLVRQGSFRNFLGWQGHEDGHRNTVFIAQFEFSGQPVTAYCKLYPEEGGTNRGLVNEVTGYLCAHALGVTQPPVAFIAEIPISRLTNPPSWLLSAPTYPAFCTERLEGKAAGIRVFHEHDARIVLEDVRGWRGLHGAIALDESIAHVDRHLNNLIRTGPRNYAVIDNGRLINPRSERWTVDQLVDIKLYDNRLSEKTWANRPGNDDASKTLKCAAAHEVAMQSISSELDYWLGLLLDGNDASRFRDFIHSRMKDAELLLRNRFGRLL